MPSAPPAAPLPYRKVNDAVSLGRLIRARRLVSGITLEEASTLTGVGIRFLSELERGKATASLGKTLHVLDRLGLDLWVEPRGFREHGRYTTVPLG